MHLQTWIHRRLTWLLMLAMVFGAFAPSVSKVLAASQDITWVEVCSAQGIQRIAIDFEGKQSPAIPTMGDNHCGYCLLQQNLPFVATTSLSWELAPKTSNRLSLGSGGTTIFKRFVRDAHHTRAPPSFS